MYIYIYIYYILYGHIPSLNFPLRSSTAGRVGTFCWRPSFSHCIDSIDLFDLVPLSRRKSVFDGD